MYNYIIEGAIISYKCRCLRGIRRKAYATKKFIVNQILVTSINVNDIIIISPILWEYFTTHQKFNSSWLQHMQRILNHFGLSYVHDEVSNLDPAGIILEVKNV